MVWLCRASAPVGGIGGLSYQKGNLIFQVSAVPEKANLTLILPYEYNGKTIRSVIRNGQPTEFVQRKIKQREVAFISLDGGGDFDFLVIYG